MSLYWINPFSIYSIYESPILCHWLKGRTLHSLCLCHNSSYFKISLFILFLLDLESRIVQMKPSTDCSYPAFSKTLQTSEALITFLFFKLLYPKKGFTLHYVCVGLCSLHITSVQVCHAPGHITMVSHYHSNEPSSPVQPLL